jgi:hypothetical protein
MARIRSIKPEFFSHEILASKSAHARLLAIGLLTLADCEGRLRWVPMQVHSQVFPWEASVNIEVLLGELLDVSYVIHYEVDGKRYVQIPNFRKHQRLTGKEAAYASLLPPPPEKPNKTLDKTGEAIGKQCDVSQGSTQMSLGTGEQGNIGTEEHRNIDIRAASGDVSVGRVLVKPMKKPESVKPQHWNDWLAVRKAKRLGPVTETAWEAIVREATVAGMSLDSVIQTCAENSWGGFKAKWLDDHRPGIKDSSKLSNGDMLAAALRGAK